MCLGMINIVAKIIFICLLTAYSNTSFKKCKSEYEKSVILLLFIIAANTLVMVQFMRIAVIWIIGMLFYWALVYEATKGDKKE